MLFTDGVVLYVNGVEVFRRNIGAEPSFDQLSSESNSSYQNDWYSAPLDPTAECEKKHVRSVGGCQVKAGYTTGSAGLSEEINRAG